MQASTTNAASVAPAAGPADLLGLDALLSAEERATRERVRQFVGERVLPDIGDWFEQARLPDTLISELGQLGVFGMHLEGYGCLGASATEYGLACMELEAADSGIRTLVSVQGSLGMYAIHRWGSESQREEWLSPMARGERIGCFALTEPGSGSDPASMKTAARQDGADWILTGSKAWITNGSIADVAIVWARTEEGIRGFLVPTNSPGFSATEIRRKLSLRASSTAHLELADVRVPAHALLPEANSLRAPLDCLNEARFGIVWGAAGAARACLEAALSYATDRMQFDRPLASFQIQQQKLATMALDVGRASLLALHLARTKEAGGVRPEQISLGKLGNVNAALDVARAARQMLGANGISLDYPVIRHLANLETVVTYEGTADIHALVVGAALTGIPAFK